MASIHADAYAHLVDTSEEIEAYCRALMETAAAIRLPALFNERREGTVYRADNRHGVTTVSLRRSALADEELVALLKYRLGQYVHPDIGIIDPRLVYASRLEHEPLENEAEGDIHFIAGDPRTGEVLCYAVLRAVPEPNEGLTLRCRNRPYLPVEKVHGWGVFNRLEVLPDLPVGRLFELGRYVKNHLLPASDERSSRAPTEVALAVFMALAGPLQEEVMGFVGDLEERIAKRTLDFFHIPTVLIRGVVPYAPEASYFFPRNQYHTVYPFAVLTSDLKRSLPRFQAIEDALKLEGRAGLKALLSLKKSSTTPHSSLEPWEGLAALNLAELPDQGGLMQERRQILDIAERLRQVDPFCQLSDAEMRLLGGFMERRIVPAGETIVRQGEVSTDLYLIESGEALVLRRQSTGERREVARLGPSHYFGEIALITGGVRTADVIARTPMVVLSLCQNAYSRFLSSLDEVQQGLERTAAERLVLVD